jgi:hypothetical protein
LGQVTNALLTRSPLEVIPKYNSPFDLHVLSTPPAFILSQDQTLRKKLVHLFRCFAFEFSLSGTTRLCLTFASYHFSVVKVLVSCRPGKPSLLLELANKNADAFYHLGTGARPTNLNSVLVSDAAALSNVPVII